MNSYTCVNTHRRCDLIGVRIDVPPTLEVILFGVQEDRTLALEAVPVTGPGQSDGRARIRSQLGLGPWGDLGAHCQTELCQHRPVIFARVGDGASELAPLDPVLAAIYGEEWVDRLFALRKIGLATTTAAGAAFAMVAALIIGAALRIAVFARREEIYVMRLVGARNGFIRSPFLLEGALAGLTGGILASGLTYGSYMGVSTYMLDVAWIPFSWVGIGLTAGLLFGTISSAVAIHLHLKKV